MADNFQQWDPGAANIESDAAYTGDSQRSGGATSGAIFASPLGNKLFYQLTIMVKALSAMLTAKGYAPNDGSASPGTALATLQAVLANIITNVDLVLGYAHAFTNPGYIKFPSWLGGFHIQWGNMSSVANTVNTQSYPVAFATAALIVIGSVNQPTGTGGGAAFFLLSASQFQYYTSNNTSVNWIALGH